jgi:GTP-binding protein HflX
VPEWHSQRLARDLDARAEEAKGLALAIGLDVVAVHTLRLRQTRAATLLGVGQIEAITPDIEKHGVQLVVVDAALSPIQQRNLETAFGTKVIDRTGLILEIFGERAATAEGRLQVELAHLDYQAGRLVRSWTHLERQRGGFGFLGGPGETQIEADRRMIRNRMGPCTLSGHGFTVAARQRSFRQVPPRCRHYGHVSASLNGDAIRSSANGDQSAGRQASRG